MTGFCHVDSIIYSIAIEYCSLTWFYYFTMILLGAEEAINIYSVGDQMSKKGWCLNVRLMMLRW